jgi:hypothetical protein
MKYRAKLLEPNTEREKPLQVFGDGYQEISRWAELVLETAPPDSVVCIYETVEQQIALIPKPRVKAKEAT